MESLILLFVGTFWEASMDTLGMPHNYQQSYWSNLANYFDRRGIARFGSQFWDNTLAWSNKWKNNDPKQGEKFPGSSTVLVTFMDGWHLVKFCWLAHLFATIVCYSPITPYLLLDGLLFYLTFGLGHELFGRLMKRKKMTYSQKQQTNLKELESEVMFDRNEV